MVDVTDLRSFEPRTTLDIEGVEWVAAPSCLSEHRLLQEDKAEVETFVRGAYFQECAEIIQDRTGAAKVIPYNYRHRRIEAVSTVSSAEHCSTREANSERRTRISMIRTSFPASHFRTFTSTMMLPQLRSICAACSATKKHLVGSVKDGQ